MHVNKKLFNKGDPEWLSLRKKFITGTELPVLFGFNGYSNPTKLYKGKFESKFEDTVYTRMGKILEPAVMNLAQIILNKDVHSFGDHRGDLMYYCESMRISATPDAYIGEKDCNIDALVELKSTSLKNLTKWGNDPPLHYLTQLSAQCVLLNVPHGYLVIMHPRYPDLPSLIFKYTIKIERLREIYSAEVARFWQHFEASPGKHFKIDQNLSSEVRECLTSSLEIVHQDIKIFDPLDSILKEITEVPKDWWVQ